jgi:hypothetical protein
MPPAPDHASTDSSRVKESLEQTDIMRTAARYKSSIKACVDVSKAKHPELTGTIVIRWTINNDGSTTNIQIATEEFRNSPIGMCLVEAIKLWKFPPYSGPLMIPVIFPFKF